MHAFCRPLHGVLCALAFLLGLHLTWGSDHRNKARQPAKKLIGQAKTFSRQWAEDYYHDELGCEKGRGSYTWRGSGFGSNVNRERSWDLLTDVFHL